VGAVERLTIGDFSGRVGEAFAIRLSADRAMPVELVEARPLGTDVGPAAAGGHPRVPFALLFRGPLTPVLPQRIYRLEHDVLGSYDLFLVPIGPDGGGMGYEVIFT
jgi:hypothetical protein